MLSVDTARAWWQWDNQSEQWDWLVVVLFMQVSLHWISVAYSDFRVVLRSKNHSERISISLASMTYLERES